MKELFEEAFGQSPLDPSEAARSTQRAPARKRFYERASVGEANAGFSVLLDGKPLRTPARAPLIVPECTLAETIAEEWQGQGETIDPAAMPLTRLANSIIDGVASRTAEVADDIARYVETDMVLYRAEGPQSLVDRQNALWNPVVDWASGRAGGRFVLAEGVMHVRQPQAVLRNIRALLPSDAWSLGALHLATTLTGSALVALALASGALKAEAAWQAAHLDEDWNFSVWGADEAVLVKRERRRRDLDAAVRVFAALPRP